MEKQLTVSFTDALLSPIGFSVLSGAGLFKGGDGNQGDEKDDLVHFHMTTKAAANADGKIDLADAIAEFGDAAKVCGTDAPLFVMEVEDDDSITGKVFTGVTVNTDGKGITATDAAGKNVMVDYYIDLPGSSVYEADITADTFAGSYYVEADTLFRDQATGKDLPANLTFPNVKLQSNFTITMASTGDPSKLMCLAA